MKKSFWKDALAAEQEKTRNLQLELHHLRSAKAKATLIPEQTTASPIDFDAPAQEKIDYFERKLPALRAAWDIDLGRLKALEKKYAALLVRHKALLAKSKEKPAPKAAKKTPRPRARA